MATKTPTLDEFLKDGYCLIVEPSQAFSASIQGCLHELGIGKGKVTISRKFDDALKIIQEQKPKLLVTEYQLEPGFGISLIEHHEKIYDEMSRISIMVTRNSSDSVVAEAAEEQVDAFLLKPFSPDMFRQKLAAVLERKLNPSSYSQKIKEGKDLSAMKKFTEAIQVFAAAKVLNEKPTLACFYAGEAYRLQGDYVHALAEFREGRKYQPLHYKCLVAEFDGLLHMKSYKEAFELVGPIKDNYPLTPRRLSQIFIATIFTLRFENIGDYYELFTKLDQRSPELIKVASMALFTSGRFYLEKLQTEKALDLFDKGVLTTGRDLTFLSKIIDELVKAKAYKEAEVFLAKCPPADVGTPEYNRLSFKLDKFTLKKDQLMEKGRKLVMAGEGNPEIFYMLVQMMAEEGKKTLAEAVINRAVVDHPELRDPLYKILEETNPSRPKKL